MSYFLSEKLLVAGSPITIEGEEARHLLLSRRIAVGESVEIQGPDFVRWSCLVAAVDKHSITVTPQTILPIPPEPTLNIILFQAFTSEQALDYIIQKATELGAHAMHIFPSKFSPRIPGTAELAKKQTRWNKITIEAAKQSGRRNGIVIHWLPGLSEVITKALNNDINFILDPYTSSTLTEAALPKPAHTIGLCVGPEGGFTPEEVTLLTQNNRVHPIRLGPRILRAETAALAGISSLQTLWGDFAD
jgi:16S rRNA (uracil1498-N3)-methyltransferase